MPKTSKVLSEEIKNRGKVTHVYVITPDGRLQALGCAIGGRRNVELGDQGVDAQSRQSGKCGLESGLAHEVGRLDVTLEANSKPRERNARLRLHVLQNSNNTGCLCIIAT